jgi:hypothetical protein
MLVDHTDACLDGVTRTRKVHLGTVNEDLALIGGVQAVEDVHQGGLASAVFAEQTVDFA